MSVIRFGLEEFGFLFRACNTAHTDKKDLAEQLALLAQANAACYNYRYNLHTSGKAVIAYTAQEILKCAESLHSAVDTNDSAGYLATMLPYNCAEDRDFLDEIEGARLAFTRVAVKFIRKQEDTIEYLKKTQEQANVEIQKLKAEVLTARSVEIQKLKAELSAAREKPVTPQIPPPVSSGVYIGNGVVAASKPRATPPQFARLPSGKWGVRAPGEYEGALVTVTRRDGRKLDMRLTAEVSPGLFESVSAQ